MKLNKKGTTYLFLVGAIAVIIIISITLLSTATADFRNAIFLKRSIQCYNLAEAGIIVALSLITTDDTIKIYASKSIN